MSRIAIHCSWEECGHLDERAKAELLASFPPYQRDARSKGIPQLGAGAIYPVPESDIFIDPIPLKPWWRRAYGLDVGWNKTAAVWLAYDSDADVAYITHEYERSMAEPSVHAGAIRLRGKWIPGVIDPASRGRAQKDGEQLLGLYQNLGLHLSLANNAVEAGLFTVFQRMTSGRLKIFNNCIGVQREFRIYRRDERGHVVKSNDHLMDACFASETIVQTETGPVKIEDLVGTVGRVISRDGALVSYAGAALTRKNAEVVTLAFEGGFEVTCTPEHRFLTSAGWCQAKEMLDRLCYDGVSQRDVWASWWKNLLSFPRPFKNFKGFVTTGWASIFGGLTGIIADCCTGMFGLRPMVASLSRTGWMFTTLTMTGPTTIRPILGSCPGESTRSIISRGMDAVFPRLRSSPPPRGIDRRLGASGIGGTFKGWAARFARCEPLFASFVGRGLREGITGGTDFVPTPAGPRRGGRLGLMMSNGFAWFVARLSWLIATGGASPVRANVVRRCLGVRSAGVRDVYCLSVPGVEAFCIEGGLVVHNCRYAVVSGIAAARMAPDAGDQFRRSFRPANTNLARSDYNPFEEVT